MIPLLPQGIARLASQLPERSALPGRRVPPSTPVWADSQALSLVLTNEPVSAPPGRFAGFRASWTPLAAVLGSRFHPPPQSNVCALVQITELTVLVPFDTDTFVCLLLISVFPTKLSPAQGQGLHQFLFLVADFSAPGLRMPVR